MNCPRCGFESPEGHLFCGKCGTRLVQACPDCGNENPPGTNFCVQCGKPQTPPAGEPAAQPRSPESPLDIDRQGERREATVAFSDLAGFTAMSERLDPEEVEAIMSRIKEAAVPIVEKHGGMVNQFVGDEVLSLFGIPTANEDDPVRAVRAALELHKMVRKLSRELEERIGCPLAMHTGINTGLILVQRSDTREGRYGITGDTVNVAARLVSLAQSDEIMLSPETRRLCGSFIRTEALEPIMMKGKSQPQIPYRVVEEAVLGSRFEAARRRGLTPLVGRQDEREKIRTTMERFLQGQGQFITVTGEAGVGKSRLLYEFMQEIPGEQVNLVEVRCPSYGGDMPFIPWIGAFRGILGLGDEDTPEALLDKTVRGITGISPALREYLPLYLNLLSIASPEHPIPKNLQGPELAGALYEAITAFMLEYSRKKPVVFIAEDWHWADKASASALGQLAGRISGENLLVIAVYRSLHNPQWAQMEHHTAITIAPLDSACTEQVIRGIWGGVKVPPALVGIIHDRTSGNPLFIEEVCLTLTEDGSAELKDGVLVLHRPPEELTLPGSVQAVIRARLDRLGGEQRDILRMASVIGREFPLRLLESITGDKGRHVMALRELMEKEMVLQTRLPPDEAYMFKQALTQEVAYETLLRQQRKELHGRVAQTIEELYAERLEEHYELLVHNYSLAENREKAAFYGKLAAKKSHQISQFQHAVSLYEQTVAWLETMGENPERMKTIVDIKMEVCWGLIGIGRFQEAEKACLEAVGVAEKLGDRIRLGKIYYGLANASVFQGKLEDTESYALKSIKCLKDTSEQGVIPIVLHLLGGCHLGQGLWRKAEPSLTEAVTQYEALGLTGDYSFGYWVMGYPVGCAQLAYVKGLTGHAPEARDLFRKSGTPELEEQGNLTTRMIYNSWLGLLISLTGEDIGNSLEKVDSLIEVAKKSDSPFAMLVFNVARVNILLGLERHEDVTSYGRALLKSIEGLPIRTGHIANLRYDQVLSALALGDHDWARENFIKGSELVELAPNWWGPRYKFLEGLLITHDESPDFMRAEACFEQSVKNDEKMGAVVPAAQTRFYRARMLVAREDFLPARYMLFGLADRFDRWGMALWRKKCEDLLRTLPPE
ncbi:MAG: AAA family ATPase [Deltaproteobacteria bacterium]|nr:AAA family ATPase [Deltaproteobacteria bacterium]